VEARLKAETLTPCSSSSAFVWGSTARKLAVPDLTTTVLTLTSTGIAADSAIAGGEGSLLGRRFIAVFATLAGAFIGAAFVSFTARSSTR